MTTTEKLERIKDRCREIIALGENRTQGAWSEYRVASGRSEGGMCFGSDTMAMPPPRQLQMLKNDAAFIAACAGPAEAMAKSTLASIETVENMRQDSLAWDFIGRPLRNDILAAWPDALLTPAS